MSLTPGTIDQEISRYTTSYHKLQQVVSSPIILESRNRKMADCPSYY